MEMRPNWDKKRVLINIGWQFKKQKVDFSCVGTLLEECQQSCYCVLKLAKLENRRAGRGRKTLKSRWWGEASWFISPSPSLPLCSAAFLLIFLLIFLSCPLTPRLSFPAVCWSIVFYPETFTLLFPKSPHTRDNTHTQTHTYLYIYCICIHEYKTGKPLRCRSSRPHLQTLRTCCRTRVRVFVSLMQFLKKKYQFTSEALSHSRP